MVALSLLLFGCSRDARLQKEVVGSWARDSYFKMTLSPNGSFVSQWTAPDKSLTYRGIWKIQDGKITTTITNYMAEGYTQSSSQSGAWEHYAIIRADAAKLVYSNDNQIISFRRK